MISPIRALLPPLLLLAATLASAEAPSLDNHEFDPGNARDIMAMCAACHGEFGQGGGDGAYPRLAGLPAAYIVGQLEDFKSRERLNIPMLPFATKRELPAEDVLDIAIHLSRLELLTSMPDLPEDTDSYERLLVAGRVFNVPRIEGDHALGASILKRSCKKCHGKKGEGRARVPYLAGQRSAYVRKQIDDILKDDRKHPDVEKHFGAYGSEDWDALIAHLSTLDD